MEIGWIYIAISITAWSITPSLIAFDRAKHNSIVANASRSLFASLFILPYVILMDYTPSWNTLIIAFLVGVSGAIIGDTAYVAALRTGSPGLVIPVSYTYVVVAQLIGYFIGLNVSLLDILASFLAIFGIYIAYGGLSKSKGSTKGLAYAIIASLAWGIFVHLVKYAVSIMDPIVLNFLRLLMASLILFIISFKLYGIKNSLSAIYHLKYTNLSGILGFGIGGSFFYTALTILKFSPVIIATALTPLTGVFVARLLLKEEVKTRHIIGTIIVIASIVLASI